MTARTKMRLLILGLVCLNAAIWAGKQIVSGLYDPILRGLGA